MKRWRVLLAFAAVVLLAVGFLVGRVARVVDPGDPATAALSRLDLAERQGIEDAPRPAYDSLADVLAIPGHFERTAVLYALAQRSDRAGLETLIAEAVGLDRASNRRAAMSILLARLAEFDADAALGHIPEVQGVVEGWWLVSVLEAVARADLQKVLGYIRGIDPALRQLAVARILAIRDDLDTSARQRIAAEFGLESWVSQVELQWSTQAAMAEDPARAWRDAVADEDPQSRERRLMMIALAWASRDPMAALAAIARLDNPNQSGLKRVVVREWAEHEPRAALSWVQAQSPSRSRASNLRRVLAELAREEPYVAASIAAELTLSMEQRKALPAVFSVWAGEDPRAAVAWFDTLSDPGVRRHAVANLASEYVRVHPKETLDWVATLSSAEQVIAAPAAIRIVAQADPQLAVRLVNRITNAEARDGAVRSLAQMWAHIDARAAARWAMDLPLGESRTMALGTTLRAWAGYQPGAVVDYLEGIDDASAFDRLAVWVIPPLAARPDVAERLYERIDDPVMKRRAAKRLYRMWRPLDPLRAERYREAATAAAP